MKTIDRCSVTFLAFMYILKVCELCNSVRASRGTKFVPEGESIEMGCDVEHCGVGWTGGWAFQEGQSKTFTPLSPSSRIQLSNHSLTVNSTRLMVHIQSINQSDSGLYQCMIYWSQNLSSKGHVTYINVTAAVDSSGRKLSHRLLVWLGVFMCLSLVLGMCWYLNRDHPSSPPVPPHPRMSFAARVKPKKEVMYAEIALNNTRLQNQRPKQVTQSTIYSSLHF